MLSVVSGQCKTYCFNLKRGDRYVIRINEIEDIAETFLSDDNNDGCHHQAGECHPTIDAVLVLKVVVLMLLFQGPSQHHPPHPHP